MEVMFNLGAIAPTLEEQANRQGYTLGKEADKLEKLKKAKSMLHLHGIINDTLADLISKKINIKVAGALVPQEEAKRL